MEIRSLPRRQFRLTNRLFRFGFVSLLPLCFYMALGQGRGGEASFSGFVRNSETGLPVAGVEVSLYQPGTYGAKDPALVTFTDSTGRFSFRSLVPARYVCQLVHRRYYAIQVTDRDTYRPDLAFDLKAGQDVDGVVFRFIPYGVIEGRVIDINGDPAEGWVWIGLRQANGTPSYVQSRTTDDLGGYRILAPGGECIVYFQPNRKPSSTTLVYQSSVDADGNALQTRWDAVTYFPGSLNEEDARPVLVKPGQVTSGIDIHVLRANVTTVRGRLLDPVSGKPLELSGARISMRRHVLQNGSPNLEFRESFARQDGSFEFINVQAGDYIVETASQTHGDLQRILVEDGQVQQVDLHPQPYQTLNVYALHDPPEPPRPWPENMQTTLINPLLRTNEGFGGPQFNASGFLKIEHLRCIQYEVFLPQPERSNLYLVAARLNGKTLEPTKTIHLTESKLPHKLELMFRDDGAEIAALPERSVFPEMVQVVLFVRYGQNRPEMRWLARQSDGSHLIQGVPPGRHGLMAFSRTPPCDLGDPGSCARFATEVETRSNGRYRLTVPISPSGN